MWNHSHGLVSWRWEALGWDLSSELRQRQFPLPTSLEGAPGGEGEDGGLYGCGDPKRDISAPMLGSLGLSRPKWKQEEDGCTSEVPPP